MQKNAMFSLAVFCAFALNACSVADEAGRKISQTSDVARHTVKIVAEVPEGTGTVYLPGNLPQLGPWDPAGYKMTGEGTRREATLQVPAGTTLEFKFTLGSWATEALAPDGSIPGNRKVLVDGDKTVAFKIEKFREGGGEGEAALERPEAEGSGVLGTLVYRYDVESEFLDYDRHAAVWLPPGYEDQTERRYPVLYMHDGQNLFDPRLSYTGVDWGVDETVVRLVEEGKIPPIIVVGVFNSPNRSLEYNPFGGGENYARFLIEELKPTIDATYRTRPEAKYTGVMGSSLGGLISLGLGWKHPDTFTRLGCLSAHLPPMGRGGEGPSIVEEIAASGGLDRSLKIYVDQSGEGPDVMYDPFRERLADLLRQWGFEEGRDFMTRKFEGTAHNEAAWRERLHIPIEFLFGDLK